MSAQENGHTDGGVTISHLLGEMAWLLTQSPLHKALPIETFEWLVMPALIHRQFYIFRDGERPIGLALWAKCGPEAEAKLQRGLVDAANRLSLEEWCSGNRLWLVDLIAPFATDGNRHREIMMADLICGPLANQEFRFHHTDAASGARTVRTVEADAGQRLKSEVNSSIDSKP